MTQQTRWRVAGIAAVAVTAVAGGALIASPSASAGTTAIVPSADAYVKQDRATGNWGTLTLLELMGGTTAQRQSYLKFPVTVPSGEQVTSATLTLKLTKVPATETLTVYSTSNSWTETGITWNTKPADGAVQDSKTVSAVGTVTFNVNVAAGDNSFVVKSNYGAVNTQFNAREAGTANAPTLTVTTSPATSPSPTPTPTPTPTVTPTPTPTPTPTVTPASTDPRGPLFDRTDLLKGTQIGAWDMDGGLLTSNASARTLIQNAGTKIVRWQMWRPPCELRATNCQTTADFNAGLTTMRNMAAGGNAVLFIGLPPIWNEQCSTGPDPWSYQWQQWVVQHVDALLDQGGSQDVIFEMGNEPDNYCAMSGQNYYDQLWTNVPNLKKWARTTLSREIFVGGPAWANSYDNNLVDIEAWLTAVKNQYTATGDKDWLPDFVSSHTYLSTPSENDTQAHAQARIDQWGTFYASLRSWLNTNFSGVSISGYPYTSMVKLIDSEYNDTIDNSWTGNNSQTWTDFYFGAMYQMFRNNGVWVSIQFTSASHSGGALDLLTTSGTAKPEYTSYAAQ